MNSLIPTAGVSPADVLAQSANKLLAHKQALGACHPDGSLAAAARAHVLLHAEQLCAEADRCGLVVTIRLEPLKPLAMSNYKPVITIYEKYVR